MAAINRLRARVHALLQLTGWRKFGLLSAFVLLQLAAMQWTQAQQGGADFDHSSTGFVLNGQHQTARCESCHLKGVFKGTPKTCEACHGWNNPRAATVMPRDHIPIGVSSCESCHAANQAQFTDAGKTFSHVSVASQTCLSCHDSRHPHPGVMTNPADKTHQQVLNSNTPCGTCHTTVQFTGPKVPTNHIPTASVACTNCHTNADFTVMPTITDIHANAPSTANNCAQCHSSANAAAYAMPTMVPPLVAPPANHIGLNGQSCEACHVGAGSSLQLPVREGAKFSNSKFNHGGVSTGCASCHGPAINGSSFAGISNMVVMPDSSSPGPLAHFPNGSAGCEVCHAASMPSGQIAATASSSVPGTGFQLPKPTAAQIHSGVTSNCVSCHDTNAQWVGMQLYPMSGYTGFQTRPQFVAGAFNRADAHHPQSGDCSDCHAGISFDPSNVKKPANHIPVAAGSTCGACHTLSDFSVMPSIAVLHANAPPSAMVAGATQCAQCHSSANAAAYAMPTMLPAIVAPPAKHISQGTLDCGSCHVGSNSSLSLPVQNGANFGNSAFSHVGASASCATCHGDSVTSGTFYGVWPKTTARLNPMHVPTTLGCEVCHVGNVPATLVPASGASGSMATFAGGKFTHNGITKDCAICHGPDISGNSFYGIGQIVVMPPIGVAGPGAHLPTSTTCESCHAGSAPSGLIAAIASKAPPGSGFLNPAPTASMIHAGVSGSCVTCHDTNLVWMSMSKYPITTSAPFKGFQTRPQATSGTFFVADAAHPQGECSNCHGGFSDFTSPSLPPVHIPYAAGAVCAACHGDFSTLPTVTKIHANAPTQGSNCAQCHSAANAANYNKNITAKIVAPPSGHIAMGNLGCEGCHVGANTSMLSGTVVNGDSFGNAAFSHSGISTGCASCHGANAASFAGVTPKNIASLSPAHLPVSASAACETCHTGSVPGMLIPPTGASAGMTTFAGASFLHSATTASCATCHGQNVSGGSFAGSPAIVVMPQSSATGPSAHIPSTASCDACHKSTPSGVIPGNASAGTGFKTTLPSTTDIHANTSSGCASCHESGMSWIGVNLYPRAPQTSYVAGVVYTGFQARPTSAGGGYSVQDATPHPVAGECSNCHSVAAGFAAPTKAANHIPTSAGCAACHKDPSYTTMPALTDIHANAQAGTSCTQCHATTSRYPMSPAIVAPPTGHVAMGALGCESCHVGSGSSMPSTTVVNDDSFANSAFSHSGVSSGCASCHGASAATIFGVSPKNIASLSPAHMPVSSAVACEVCHTNNVPSMLIPATGASGGMTTFAGASFLHSATSASCASCHGQNVSGASFAGNASIIAMPQSGVPGSGAHVPTTAACNACHKSAPSGLIPGITSKSVGNSDFRLAPLPTKTDLHANVNSGCASCHEVGMSWIGVDLYPRTATYSAGSTAPYIGFQTRPTISGSGYSLADASHPAVGECSNCHSVSAGFAAPTKAADHIPTNAACGACHKSPDYAAMPGTADIHANASVSVCTQCHSDATRYPMTPPIVVPPARHIAMGALGCEVCHVGAGSSMASLPVQDGAHFSGSLFNHSSFTTGCASCHGDAVTGSSFYGVLPKATAGLAPAHMPASASCQSCHVNSTPTGLVPSAGMKTFAGAGFIHTGISSGCETCHGPNVVAGSFAGNPSIVVMPQSSVAGASAHIPSSTTCESCHLGSMPASLVPFSASAPAIGSTGFRASPPPSAKIHANSNTASCTSCHEGGMAWVGVDLYPRTSSVYVPHAIYTGFQTRPGTGGSYAVNDASHPGAGQDCASCHGNNFSGFGPLALPSGHIPVAASSTCGNCHSNFSTPPSIDAIHSYAPSQTSNCAQCHSVDNAALYKVTRSIVTPPIDHIPMGSLGCESCHVGALSSIKATPVKSGDSFAASLFNHAGTTVACSYCHGVNVDASTFKGLSGIKVLSYTATPPHMKVNSQLGCETCHTNSVPTGQVGVGIGSKTFSGANFIHSNVTENCELCHGPTITPASFMGNPKIVVMPPSAVSGAGSHIPSSTTCESCHLSSMPAGLMAGSASKTTGPGTGFQSPAPNSSAIHGNSNVGSCNLCHEKNQTWLSMSMYPGAPAGARVPGATYTGFQTRPYAGGTGTSVNDSTHVGTGECSDCHNGFTGFAPPVMGSNHIPVSAAGAATCSNCHTNANFAVMPQLSRIHKYAPSATANCAQCHSATNAALYPMTPALKAPAGNHIPMGALGCESCHVDSLTNLTTLDTPTFAGSKYSHTGVTSGCAACHVSGAGPFQGTLSIVAMPVTSPAVSTSHLPTSTQCEICHLGSTPATPVPAVATNSAATSAFGTPVPTAAMIHTGVSGSCSSCHEAGGSSTSDVWMNMAVYPITSTAPFKGFQTRPSTAAQFRVADSAHPTTGDCSSCHLSFTDFATAVKPANHIPTAAASTCQSCHTSSDYTAMPTLTNIHRYAPSTTSNCVQCHSAANAQVYNQLPGMRNALVSPNGTHVAIGALGCENCHVGANSSIAALPVVIGATFRNSAFSHSGISSACASCHGDLSTARSFVGQTQTLTPKAMPANHVPNPGGVDCVACHTTVPSGLIAFTGGSGAGNTFATTQYSHSGITSNCNLCHGVAPSYIGIGNMVVLPTATSGASAHIPATNNATCEACHLGSTPSALTPVSTGAPKALGSTGFLSPLPTGVAIHDGMTGGCSTCHENPKVWLGVGLYPRSPATYQAGGASYVGFHTRPVGSGAGSYSVTDASHPTTGDCSQCHGSTLNFSITAKPVNHIPTTAACDKCHTNITPADSNFSVMPTFTNIHAYAPTPLSNCAQCHSDANAARYAIPSIGFAIKSPASIARHVPFGASVPCETCHVVSGPVLNGASFAGGKFSHSGITTGCAACHGNGLAANYFTGISNLVAIPATAAMGATAHIPYTAACEACHTGSGSIPSTLLAVTGTPAAVSGFRLPAPAGTLIHNGINSGCNACHESNYLWKGVDLYPINPKLVTTGASYTGFQSRPIPAPATAYGINDSLHPLTGDCSQCHTGTTVFTALAKPAGHMPTTAPLCSTCHSSDYSVAGLSSLTNLHTSITAGMVTYNSTTIGGKTCSTCHVAGVGGTSGFAPFTGCTTAASCAAPPPLNSYQPATTGLHPDHVPIGTLDCNGCHAVVSPSFVLSSMMKNQIMHDNVKLAGVLCKDCHENGLSWYGVTGLKVRVPSKHTTTARKAPNNCDNAGCHANSTVSNGFRALPQAIMRSAHVAPDMGRIRPNPQAGKLTRGSLGNSYDHKTVGVGKCKDCHDGKAASGLPARHLMVSTSCDTCHRSTTWLPAQFSHKGITPNTCLACHNGMGASAKPPGHFMTARSCDACHKDMQWTPVNYQHLSPLYRAAPDKLGCVSCHDTNGEIIRRQARGLNRTKPIPVGAP